MRTMKYCLSGAAGIVALGLMTLTAQATPPGVNLKAGATSSVEKVDYRRCWWRHGRRHCRWVREHDDYDYDYPYFYGPSLGFYFGGGGGHRHHHHHH